MAKVVSSHISARPSCILQRVMGLVSIVLVQMVSVHTTVYQISYQRQDKKPSECSYHLIIKMICL